VGLTSQQERKIGQMKNIMPEYSVIPCHKFTLNMLIGVSFICASYKSQKLRNLDLVALIEGAL
jgi:hypothetical protein